MIKIDKKIFFLALAVLLSAVCAPYSYAQIKLRADTLECHIVGFGVGLMAPSSALSQAWGADGGASKNGTMASLYTPPYLDFDIKAIYKYQSNWIVTLEGDMWFGISNDNLTHQTERMGDIYIGEMLFNFGGTDGVVNCYNRGLTVRAGMGKILPMIDGNPNSGLTLRVAGGWMWQRTVFMQNLNESPVPQLSDRYRRLYDHYRNGFILTEGIGFTFMSNHLNLVNFLVELQVSQSVSWSSRKYMLDNYMGLNGKDGNTYFDLIYGLKFTWMFPLKGKTAYDYYF